VIVIPHPREQSLFRDHLKDVILRPVTPATFDCEILYRPKDL